ncbi:MAG: vanadium-dependent haloperoxidase [Chitinophagaceae bacterium]
MKNIFHCLILIAFVLSSCNKDSPGFPGPGKNDSRLITDWIGLHLQVIRNTTGVTHIAYSRHFAYTGVALYESLVKGAPHYKSIASRLNGNVAMPALPKGNSIFHPAAANAAIAGMLRFFYSAKPENIASIDSLEEVYVARFVDGINGNNINLPASVNYGKQVASVIIEWSKQDGAANANIPYTPLGEGYWEPTPTAMMPANMPGWGNNKPILPGSTNGTLPVAPIAFSKEAGSAFHTMVKEVYDVSQSLTDDQKAIALFWDDAPNSKYVSVFGHWFSIFRQVLEKEMTPLIKGAEAYLRLGVAMNDATISCWKGKYTYHTIRPVSYIRKYMGYGDWNSMIGTPPHPEYSSAHSTISAAGVYALESVFGTNYSFTDHTYDGIGMVPRSFNSFDAAAKEAGLSRLYAGIHYRATVETGNIQGKKVGTNVISILKTH